MNIRVMLTVAILTATTLPALAQDRRQEDKNLMRNLGLGLGVAALNEARKGNSNKAVLLGAGALYAGKKYEDQRRNQNWDDDRGRWSRADRWDRDRFDNRRDNDDCRDRDRFDNRRGNRGRWDRDDDDDCGRNRGRRGRGRR
jgi:hypothetical protein